MKKRLIALAMALALCISVGVVPAYAGDGASVYRFDAAKALWMDGLFLGDGTSFALDKSLTRAEGITMLVRVLGKDAEAKAGSWSTPFADVSGWAAPYVGYAYANGLTKGTGDAAFSPEDTMGAKQFLTLILRALGYNDGAGDFSYNEAEKKALEVGLIDQFCYEMYTTTAQFRRDDAAQISYTALGLNKKDSTATLRSTITVPGRPEGSLPYATAADAKKAHETGLLMDANGRTHYKVYINGTQRPEVDAYIENPYTTVWLPVEYLAKASGCTTKYDALSDGGKLTVSVGASSTYSYSVDGNSLQIADGVAYIAHYSGVWDKMGITIASDDNVGVVRISGSLNEPSGDWNSVKATGVQIDTSKNDASFKLVWGQNGGNMTNTYRYAGGQVYAVDYLFTLYAGKGGTYTMNFPYDNGKADTVTLFTVPEGVYDVTYTYGIRASSDYDYTYDLNITVTGPNSASLSTRDRHPGTLSPGGLSYTKVGGADVIPEGALKCLSCGGSGCELCHQNGCFAPEAGSRVCTACGGDGRVVCPECNGEGYKPQTVKPSGGLYGRYQDDASQYYENQKKCPTCNNDLTVTCTVCGGDGYAD